MIREPNKNTIEVKKANGFIQCDDCHTEIKPDAEYIEIDDKNGKVIKLCKRCVSSY